MSYNSKYTGAEIEDLLDKAKKIGDINEILVDYIQAADTSDKTEYEDIF